MFTVILPVHYTGGMQFHAQQLTEGLAARGHDVTVITTAHPDEIKCEEVNSVKIHYLNTPPDKYSKKWWTESTKKFRELHEKTNFDVVLSESIAGWGYIKNNLRREHDIPFVCIQHGTASSELKSRLRNRISFGNLFMALRKVYDYFFVDLSYLHKSDAIIVTSNKLKDKIIKEHFITRRKVFTVFNGVDTNVFNPTVKSQRIKKEYCITGKNEKIILYVGRIIESKGIQYLIEVLPEILKKIKVKLLIVGDGDYVGELKALSNRLGVSDHVFFCGRIPDKELPKYYSVCDVFVLPTLHDESPLTVLEAMACSKPVILSKATSLTKLMQDKEDIIFIELRDKDSLSRAITNVLTDDELAERISENAREKILEKYGIDSMVDGTIKVLEHVTSPA